jgi:hypothetical protein
MMNIKFSSNRLSNNYPNDGARPTEFAKAKLALKDHQNPQTPFPPLVDEIFV